MSFARHALVIFLRCGIERTRSEGRAPVSRSVIESKEAMARQAFVVDFEEFDSSPHFPYARPSFKTVSFVEWIFAHGGFIPGMLKSNIRQRVSLPGGFSFGLHDETLNV